MSDDFPDVKIKGLFNFPANVVGGPNVVISKSNGIYTVSLDFTGPWVPYTPNVSAGSGALTSATAQGRFLTIGKTVFVNLSISVVTNGTGAGNILASLPLAALGPSVMPGRGVVSTKMLQGLIGVSGVTIQNYDGTYPASTGETLLLNGMYEAA